MGEFSGSIAASLLGFGTFNHPACGTPVRAGRLTHNLIRHEQSSRPGLEHLFAESRIAALLFFKRAYAAPETFGCFDESSSSGEDGADSSALVVIQEGPGHGKNFLVFGGGGC